MIHRVALVILLVLTLGSVAAEAAWVRYKTDGTRRVVHLSKPAFTTAPNAGEADIQVADVVLTPPLPGPASQLRLTADLTALELDPALVPPPAEDPDGLRKTLGTIFAGTAAQKRTRWGDILQAHPWVTAVLTLLRAPMTADATATVTEIITRICQRVGGGQEVLTATEYDALKTLADGKNLGALVPARPCP